MSARDHESANRSGGMRDRNQTTRRRGGSLQVRPSGRQSGKNSLPGMKSDILVNGKQAREPYRTAVAAAVWTSSATKCFNALHRRDRRATAGGDTRALAPTLIRDRRSLTSALPRRLQPDEPVSSRSNMVTPGLSAADATTAPTPAFCRRGHRCIVRRFAAKTAARMFRDLCARRRKPFQRREVHDGFATGPVSHGRKKNPQQFDDVTRLKYQCRILRP
jgi:hypothetical protein